MSYNEVSAKYPTSDIKMVHTELEEKYLQKGFKKVSDCIIDNWGIDLSHCYMVR